MNDKQMLNIEVGGADSLSQSRSVTAHPAVLKTLGWVKEHLSEAVIVESGKTSKGWWRKWSDGFIEQGGEVVSSSEGQITITFLKAFSSSTSYIAVKNVGSHYDSVIHDRCVSLYGYTASSVKTYHYWNYDSRWYAAGY